MANYFDEWARHENGLGFNWDWLGPAIGGGTSLVGTIIGAKTTGKQTKAELDALAMQNKMMQTQLEIEKQRAKGGNLLSKNNLMLVALGLAAYMVFVKK